MACAKEPSRRILCVGMCVLDVIHVVDQYPVEDSDKRSVDGYWQRGGNASNNCSVLKQLSTSDIEFLGMMTGCPAFSFLKADCENRGIIVENCPTANMDPPFSSVILNNATGSRTIVHSNPGFPSLKCKDLCRLQLKQYAWIHLEGRDPEKTLTFICHIHEYNKQVENQEERIPISVDLEQVNEDILILGEVADYVFLGKDLAKHLGWTQPKQAVMGLYERYKPQKELGNVRPAIICPWDAKGAGCVDACGNYTFVPSTPVELVVDSLGAGDTFCAAVIFALQTLKRDLPAAVRFGHNVAAFKMRHRGYDALKDFKEEGCKCVE